MTVRLARSAELATVMTVFDSGNLDVDPDRVSVALDDGRLLAACEDGRVLGALLLVERRGATEIEAVAVRPGRRGQGLGTALVRGAGERHGRLVAEFDEALRPFWASLGFVIEPAEEAGRLVGRFVG